MTNEPGPAGGRATASGMNFQAGVGAWFAAHLATATPLGARFGLSATALPERLQFETAQFLDDISMELSDGSSILVQCKTRPAMSAAKGGPLADTVAQLASLLLKRREQGTEPDPSKVAAVLAVAADASGSLDDLEAACRYLDLGATWTEATGYVSARQRLALGVLADSARAAWTSMKAGAPNDSDLAALARLFHVIRFDVGDGGADRRAAASLIGAKLLGDEGAGTAALASLGQVVDRMTRTGAPADRIGLVQRLRAAGFSDTRSPGYDEDIQLLMAKTSAELFRLARHARLSTSPDAPIPRECSPALAEAIHGGSLLVIGEPGAGKTGVLVTLVENLSKGTAPLVLLSVDSLSNVTGRDMLRTELQLEHEFLEVLANWPGREPGVLVIDALDASRGGPLEVVFANLIEEGLQRLGGRWSIVASIRTFDLKNGTRFRAIMAGEPPAAAYRDADLDKVRHFLVPRLSVDEVGSLAQSDPKLSRLIASAPPPLQALLRNVFNLSLAADLVSLGATAESISSITTQSGLIWTYEDARLGTDRLRIAVGDTLKVMIEKRRITVLRSLIRNEAIGEVVQSGVLALASERIAFSHHVLFDHAASRYYLEWDDMDALAAQVSGDPAIGLLLGPALRFAVERAWRLDGPGHANTWRLIARLCAIEDIDPVVTSVALRTAAEGVVELEDVAGLLALLRSNERPRELATTLDRLARFVSMRAGEPNGLSRGAKMAWAAVAREGVRNLAAHYSDGVRVLLMTMIDRGDFSDGAFASAFGVAARDMLSFAWSKDPDMQGLANQAIRFVAASYASDMPKSRALLKQIIRDPHYELHAHEETPWLAEGAETIASLDPAFTFEIYQTLFGRNIPLDGHSWVGGRPSRILPLSSNRKQDYEHGRWHLKGAFPTLMRASPHWGTRTASAVAIGTSKLEWPTRAHDPVEIVLAAGQRLALIEDCRALSDWRSERYPDNQEEILASFTAYLRECDGETFGVVVETALVDVSACSVWSRILGIGAERPDVAGNLLWPVASSLPVIALHGVSRDTIFFLAAAYSSRSKSERATFEAALIDWLAGDADGEKGRFSFGARVLSTIPEEALVTASARQLKIQLGSEGKLAGNRPYVSFERRVGEKRDIVDSLLRGEGADLSKGPDKAMRDATRELEEMLREPMDEYDAAQVSRLWTAIQKVLSVLDDAVAGSAHVEVQHASLGAVGNAAEKITEAEAYAPDSADHPSLDEIIALVDRLAASRYPEPKSDRHDNGLLAWGNWDVRVYAASALMDLCRRFGNRDPSFIDRLFVPAFDPIPAVRLQIAQSLNTLWDVARPAMWNLATRIGREELHLGVLGAFANDPLRRISEPEPERAEAIADEIIRRLSSSNDKTSERGREPASEALAGLACRLWIGRARPIARGWIDDWVADLVSNEAYLWTLIFAVRSGLFQGYIHPEDETSIGIQQRSKELIDEVARAASEQMRTSQAEFARDDLTPETRARVQTRYQVADKLLDHVANQLYFGSGVFRRNGRNDVEDDIPGLADDEAKKAFLEAYSDTLDVLGQSGTAHTLHHLVELYGYLADAAPGAVFDRVAELLVGPARREKYQSESLASDALVRLVRRYLADHREVFEDVARRGRLVAVLELFSGAGWPEALKLLYELPDLLR